MPAPLRRLLHRRRATSRRRSRSSGSRSARDHEAAKLSGGQRRRLDVALALIGDPELVFLDEPTTGFDPAARRQAWEVIGGLRALGKTIVLTTHYMEEAERLADRIVVMARGEIVADGTPATLGGRDRAAAFVSFTLPPGAGDAAARLRGRRARARGAAHRAPDGRAARADRLGAGRATSS